MKKLFISLSLILFTLLACERELELTSDFNFEVNNIDDTEIFINTIRPIELEMLDVKNVNYNKDYKVSYKVVSGDLTLKDGTTTLIEDTDYILTADELDKIYLDLIPQSGGVIKVRFTVKDNNNIIKEKEVLVFCNDEDFEFTFTGAVPNPDAEVGNNIPFNLEIENTGLSSNSFQLKYVSSGTGTLTIGGVVKPANTYFSAPEGLNSGFYNSLDVGLQTITFTCKDINGTEIPIDLDFNFTASPFTLTKIADFSCKNTLKKDFQFTLSDLIAASTYQVKFTSINSSKIFLGTTQLSMGNWLPLTLDQSTLYTFKYQADSNINDVLTVEIKDSYGQIQTINYNVTVFSKPLLNGNIIYNRSTNCTTFFLNNYSATCVWSTKCNTSSTIFGGATLVQTKIIIKNKNTGNFDTLIFNNSLNTNYLENDVVGRSGSSCTSASNNASTFAYNQSKYAGQLYSIQVQDSDGVWSDLINGTSLVN